MKKVIRNVGLMTLALVLAISCTSGAMAFGFDPEDEIENRAEQFADSIEEIVENAGEAYEENAENYPDEASSDPAAPFEYLKNVFSISGSFMSGLRSLFTF